MTAKHIPSTEFQTRIGRYIDEAGKGPIYITKHNRPIRVLVDVDEYERLKRHDTRQALYPHELGDDLKADLEAGYQGGPTPDLDHLLK